MTCPLGKVQETVQPLIAVAPAVTVTSAWKPPDHELVTAYTARAPLGAGGDVVGPAEGDTLAEAEAEAEAVGDGVAPGRAAR